jgi:hypothetical protein
MRDPSGDARFQRPGQGRFDGIKNLLAELHTVIMHFALTNAIPNA